MKITISVTRIDETTAHHPTELNVNYLGEDDSVLGFNLDGVDYFTDRKDLLLLLRTLMPLSAPRVKNEWGVNSA